MNTHYCDLSLTMKLLVILAVLITLAKASDEDSQSKVRDIISRLPKFKRPNSASRIINGNPAGPHSRPYQVAMAVTYFGDDYFCSGTLISTKFVLTAAHCVDGTDNGTVILGAHDLFVEEDSQVERPFSKGDYRVHEGWSMDTVTNDIATIEFQTPVELNEFIQLITLPTHSERFNRFIGKKATISGWGATSDPVMPIKWILREVETNVITNIRCYLMFKIINYVTIRNSHICTSGFGGVGACGGDSGGPALIGDKQIGIASFVNPESCETGWPTAFTRITSFLDWIESNSDVKIPL